MVSSSTILMKYLNFIRFFEARQEGESFPEKWACFADSMGSIRDQRRNSGIYGDVVKVGNTSIELYLEARAHNVYSGHQTVILSTNITFVRIDENGDPIPIAERVKMKYQ